MSLFIGALAFEETGVNLLFDERLGIIIGSWCGKKFQPEEGMAREGWNAIPAVKNKLVFEIKSADILQPGLSVFTYGLKQLETMLQQWGKTQ